MVWCFAYSITADIIPEPWTKHITEEGDKKP